ncbi:MAG: histidine ammonia-lyase [Parcubacteria group bacterium Gr01-1014_30]|nr:MAG: histidine ammonia-lyase [Parcubacteria group bacterium Gr01-1014_30]
MPGSQNGDQSQDGLLRAKSIAQDTFNLQEQQRLMKPKVTLDGDHLGVRDVDLFVHNPSIVIELSEAKLQEVDKSRKFLERELNNRIIYGVNTGFGPMASHIINQDQLERLQENLVRSHAVGMGAPIDTKYVLAAMIIRLNTLTKRYSGVSRGLIEHLQKVLNHRIVPVIPEHGAVGTSGDLVQLAHIALSLTGQGYVFYQEGKQPTSKVFQRLQVQPYKLKAKEGLSLINGTSAMCGAGTLNCLHAHRLLSLAIRFGAFALELVHAYGDSISEKLQKVRPHRGQVAVAKAIRETLASSSMLHSRKAEEQVDIPDEVKEISEVVQEIYSFRCIPQILGPVYDALYKAQKDIEVEINSSSDNPIVDLEGDNFLHGGNFHGDYIAFAMDQLKLAIIKLTMLSERRINFFLHQKLNNFFPPFLNLGQPGLTLGLQGLQFVATSTTSQSQTLAFPQYIHSIPTNADNQDVVSTGMESALLASKIMENAYIVLAIELITLAQATDFRGVYDKLSNSSKDLFKGVRSVFPKIVEDRIMVDELPRVVEFLKSNQTINPYIASTNHDC